MIPASSTTDVIIALLAHQDIHGSTTTDGVITVTTHDRVHPVVAGQPVIVHGPFEVLECGNIQRIGILIHIMIKSIPLNLNLITLGITAGVGMGRQVRRNTGARTCIGQCICIRISTTIIIFFSIGCCGATIQLVSTSTAFQRVVTLVAEQVVVAAETPDHVGSPATGNHVVVHGTLNVLDVIAQCKARWPEVMEDRFFNTLFVLDPNGEVVHKAAKNHIWARERSCVPHDIYDRWTEVFGDDIDAFYPVLKTDDIGNIGTIVCSDGEYPEVVRALAFNGAELVYRSGEALPMTNVRGAGGSWMVQNRGHAEFNNVYMICPNLGALYLHPEVEHPINLTGGNSHIVDYQGQIMSHQENADNTFTSAVIDIEALRQFRAMNLNSNWLKDMRMELFKKMYDRKVHSINLWMEQDPLGHEEVEQIYRDNIQRLYDMGAWTPPAHKFQGCYMQGQGPDDTPPWEEIKKLWDDED